jgi:hypothetical protein
MRNALPNMTAMQFGEDRIWEAIQVELAVQNRLTTEFLRLFCEFTNDNMRRYGSSSRMQMQRVDQRGSVMPQKPILPGQNIGIPLALYDLATQWTTKALERLPAQQMARNIDAATLGDRVNVMSAVRTALFNPTNHVEYENDLTGNPIELPVKVLLNADGQTIPLGPQGESFNGGSHTHYMFAAAPSAADGAALLENVVEHFASGDMRLYINRQEEPTVEAWTGFKAYDDPRLREGAQAANAGALGGVQFFDLNNRRIGVFRSAQVEVKAWVPPGYLMAVNLAGPKVLAYRTYDAESGQFRLVFRDRSKPLEYSVWEREFGVAVVQREVAAIMRVGGSYTAPANL